MYIAADGSTYLVMARYFDATSFSHNTSSFVFRWNQASRSFVRIQEFATRGARGVKTYVPQVVLIALR
jgi:hypothetical protein